MKHKTPIILRVISLIVPLVFFWINILNVFECYSGSHYKVAAFCATGCLFLAVIIIMLSILFLIEDNSDDYKE